MGRTLLVISAALVGAACEGPRSEVSTAVDTAHIVLGGRGAEEHVVPGRVFVRSGGAVVFRTVDNRVHTIVFQADSLAPEAFEFLNRTGQLRSPPLISEGTTYRISLAGAPPGFYPFLAEGPGPPVPGVVFVE